MTDPRVSPIPVAETFDRDKIELRRRLGRGITPIVGIGLSGIFLYLAVRKVDFVVVRSTFRNANLVWLIPMIGVALLDFWLRAVRWASLFPPFARPGRAQAFNAFVIGGLANNIIAGRVGDIARAGLIGPLLPEIGTSGALATVVLERVMDGLVLLAFLGAAFLLAPLPSWVERVGTIGILVFVGMLVALFLINRRHHSTHSHSPADHQGLKSILYRLLDRFVGGLSALKSKKHFAVLIVFTVAIWLLEALLMFSAFRAFALVLPFIAAIVCLVLLTMGLMFPAAPGFIGTYQFFLVSALRLYKVPEAQGLAIALFLNLFVFIFSTVVGLIAMAVSGFKLPVRIEKRVVKSSTTL